LSDSQQGQETFLQSVGMDLGSTRLPSHWAPGVFSPGVKQPGREADHSPPSSVEVRNEYSYTSISPYDCTEYTETIFIFA
jgi:hypothetical protein